MTQPIGIHVLASGRFADVAPDGSVELLTCGWLVPDCYMTEDGPVETVVECGAPWRIHPVYGDAGWVCDDGHEHLPLEVAWAPYGPEWEREARERFAETGQVI